MRRGTPLLLMIAGLLVVGAAALIWLLLAESSDSWETRLSSEDPVEVEAARDALLAGTPEHLEALGGLLAGDDVSAWQREALQLKALEITQELGATAAPLAPQVLALAEHGSAHVRTLAASTLPAIGVQASTAVPVLIRSLQQQVSVPALRALAEYGNQAEPAVEPLVRILGDQQFDAETRWNAARTLGKMRESGVAAVDALVQHLKDNEQTVREHAAEALGDIGPPARDAAPALIAVLDDEYFKVRRDAVRSLGQINADPAIAVPAIQPLLEDQEQIVREAAQTALDALQPAPPGNP